MEKKEGRFPVNQSINQSIHLDLFGNPFHDLIHTRRLVGLGLDFHFRGIRFLPVGRGHWFGRINFHGPGVEGRFEILRDGGRGGSGFGFCTHSESATDRDGKLHRRDDKSVWIIEKIQRNSAEKTKEMSRKYCKRRTDEIRSDDFCNHRFVVVMKRHPS